MINNLIVLQIYPDPNARSHTTTAEAPPPEPADRLGISSYGVSMTTLEEVFLHLETQRDGEEGTAGSSAVTATSGGGCASAASVGGGAEADAVSGGAATASAADDCTGLGKHMVRNRALSRSVSLQGGLRCGADSAESLAAVALQPASPPLSTHRRQPSAGSRTTTTMATDGGVAAEWLELDGLQLRPNAGRTLLAMLRLRCVIMGRDLQRLYLMIVLPLAFTAIGLYLNSIQVIMPVMRAGVLNGSTYTGAAGRLAVYDATGNPDGADFRYIVAQLNGTTTTTTAMMEDAATATSAELESEWWGGNFTQLLAVEPHMGALRVEALSWSQVTVRALYNDTAQHSLPIVLNLLSNALYRMNGEWFFFSFILLQEMALRYEREEGWTSDHTWSKMYA